MKKKKHIRKISDAEIAEKREHIKKRMEMIDDHHDNILAKVNALPYIITVYALCGSIYLLPMLPPFAAVYTLVGVVILTFLLGVGLIIHPSGKAKANGLFIVLFALPATLCLMIQRI